MARIFFYKDQHGRYIYIFFSQKAVQNFVFGDNLLQDFFYSNKELDSPTYCKTTKSYPEDSTDSVDFIKKKSQRKLYLNIYGSAMGTKMAVPFAKILMNN